MNERLASNQLILWYLQYVCIHTMSWSPREFIINYTEIPWEIKKFEVCGVSVYFLYKTLCLMWYVRTQNLNSNQII